MATVSNLCRSDLAESDFVALWANRADGRAANVITTFHLFIGITDRHEGWPEFIKLPQSRQVLSEFDNHKARTELAWSFDPVPSV